MTDERQALSPDDENLPSSRYLWPVIRTARYLHRNPDMATWVVLIMLTLVAFLLRTPYLDAQSLWRDEVDVIRFATEPLLQRPVDTYTHLDGEVDLIRPAIEPLVRYLAKVGHNGPLYYLIMRGWLRLAGDGEFALRYPSLCFGILTVPLAYRAGRRLAGRQAATITAALIAVSPYLVWYSQDAKMYALVTALTLLAMTCLLEALTKRGLWWVGFVLFASLSLYVHLLSALMIPVYLAAFLLARPHDRRQWRGGLISFGLLTLPYLPLASWQLPLVLNSYQTGHPFYPIHQMLSLLFNLYARGVTLAGGWVVVAAFVFAILGGLFFFMRGDPPTRIEEDHRPYALSPTRSRLLLLLWLFLPIALVYLISLRAPVFEPRYLIFIAPAFYLLVALGIMALSRLSWIPTGPTLAVILSFSLLALWIQATTPIKSDFRAAASYVVAHRQGDEPIMFQMAYVRHTFDYYFDHEFAVLEGPWTNDGVSETQVEELMAQRLEGYSSLWLVASEAWLRDSRGLTQAWLNQHARLVESASFTLVDVYHYDLSTSQ